MTATTLPGKKLALPDPGNPPVVLETNDISFVEIIFGDASDKPVLRIYLMGSSSIDVPATAANIEYLESLGFTARNKYLITGSRVEDVPDHDADDSKSSSEGEVVNKDVDPPPPSAANPANKNNQPK